MYLYNCIQTHTHTTHSLKNHRVKFVFISV